MKSIGASLLLLLFLCNPYRGRYIFAVSSGGGTRFARGLPVIEIIPRGITHIAQRIRLFIDGADCYAIPTFFIKHFSDALT